MTNELQAFVKEALQSGASRSAIQGQLRNAGWQEDEVKTALDLYLDTDFPVPVPRRKPYLSAREAFMYLVMFFTLYTSAIAFGTLLFQYVNRWLPDPINNPYYYDGTLSAIRNATAALIIAFPVFLFVARSLYGAIRKDPEKRASKVRKWLTYLTLFVAAGVIIGDLITLVNYLLSGELTLRFVLKVVIVLGISGTIFGYYLWDLRQEEQEA